MAHRFFQNERIQAGLTPRQYHQILEEQAAASEDGLSEEAAEKLQFTQLNLHRTNRITRTFKIPEDLAALMPRIDGKQTWMLLTEPWCGDSAQCLPYISAMAALNENIDLRLILRDENLDIMDDFLTNGTRSIPRLVIFNDDGDELIQWGPRPAEAQIVFTEAKEAGLSKPEIMEKLHLFYGRNRGAALVGEFQDILSRLVNP